MSEPIGAALLRPVRGGNAFEDTVQRLVQSIRLGVVSPGDRLPSERELALQLGVSRSTLREAIAALAEVGLISSRRGRYGGTFVTDEVPDAVPTSAGGSRPSSRHTAAELDDTLGVRAVLETAAARRAAERALTAQDRDRLWMALQESGDAPAADYRRRDSRLHLAIAEVAGIPSLVPLVADARSRVNLLLDEIPLLAPNIEHSNDQHRAVVGAILTGRGMDAERAMSEHLEGTAALLRGFLSSSE